MTPPRVALTIAGFDPSSGAGITADLQVFAAHGFFAVSAITALTVQSTRGVREVRPVEPALLRATLDELRGDLPVSGIKIGMLGSAEIVNVVGGFLESLAPSVQERCPVVLDPVLRSSSGSSLLAPEALERFRTRLLPLVDCLTPNWAELATLSGLPVRSEANAADALASLGERYPRLAIVATGGESPEPVDLLWLPGRPAHSGIERITGEHVATTSTHGTGCAFSSALLCNLSSGQDLRAAAIAAKRFVEGALRHAPGVGHGRGPMDLLWPLRASGAKSDRAADGPPHTPVV